MKIKIKQKIILQIIKMKLPSNRINYSKSFSLTFILNQLDINITDNASSLLQFSYGVFLLSIVGLFCFINIIGYILTFYLIQKSNYEIKYPRLNNFINRYKNISLIYLSIEILLCLFCLILLVIFSLLYIYSLINKT
jgi:putative copper export protein